MNYLRVKTVARLLMTLATFCAAGTALGGGSGLNVIVVVNQNSANSIQLGNDYCEARGVPPQNVLRMTGWTGGAISWSRADFETDLCNPLLAMVSSRGLTHQAHYVLLSTGIPYRVIDGGSQNSTTSALFYGFKTNTPVLDPNLPNTCALPDSATNSYAFSELPFPEATPNNAPTNSFLAMMLTDTNLAGAEMVLMRSVASDSTFPTQAVYLEKTSDWARNVRFTEFDNALFDARLVGDQAATQFEADSTAFSGLLGLQTGLWGLSLPNDAFIPGTMADTLTSFAGGIFENQGQTTLLAFLHAGASASYGAVVEPCNYLEKFPNPLVYLYQYRGFSLAEAYYQSVLSPFEGLMVGEPLSAPFAHPGGADWRSLTNGTVLSGVTPLTMTFFAAATNLPVGRADLFLDGQFVQTMTNLPPSPGNTLSVTLNGFRTSYTAPPNATIASVISGLANVLNARQNVTRVQAYPTGDRLELESLNTNAAGAAVTVDATTAAGSAPALTAFLRPLRPTFLDTMATGYVGVAVSNAPAVGDWLSLDVFKTNGTEVRVSVTNTVDGAKISDFTQTFMSQINSNALLQTQDGVFASDLSPSPWLAFFYIRGRSAGWPASQVEVQLHSSPNLVPLPAGAVPLQDNLTDLRPRNHLYLSSGAQVLPVNFDLDTTRFQDGYHQLTAVGYEGTSVRTQTRISRQVVFQNTRLSATLALQPGGTNVTLDATLTFTVTANNPDVATVDLFSTGGSVASTTNQNPATFVVPAASRGPGLQPFYALVTDVSGNQYRTATTWLRIIPPLTLSIAGPPLTLSWPASPGQRYDILAAPGLSTPFQKVDSLAPLGATAHWPIPASNQAQEFYRVRLDAGSQ